jgi:hypothetical protein
LWIFNYPKYYNEISPQISHTPFLSHIDVHLCPCLDANQTKNVDLIIEYDIVGVFLYLIINIDLNVPCYFVSIQEMINDYPTNKI